MRKRTIRRLPETTRRVAKLVNELASIQRRMKNILPKLQELEFEAKALEESMKQTGGKGK